LELAQKTPTKPTVLHRTLKKRKQAKKFAGKLIKETQFTQKFYFMSYVSLWIANAQEADLLANTRSMNQNA